MCKRNEVNFDCVPSYIEASKLTEKAGIEFWVLGQKLVVPRGTSEPDSYLEEGGPVDGLVGLCFWE